jgi:hypothetical protein
MPNSAGAMGGRNDLASVRLVNYAGMFVASTGGFEEFTYLQARGWKKEWSRNHKIG